MQNRVKKRNIKKKYKFFFSKNRLAYLVFNRSFSNIFITLLDLNFKVIKCISSGICDVGSQKKIKKAAQTVENIIETFLNIFELYNIKLFNIILKVKFSGHVVLLVKELTDRGFFIKRFINRIKIAHNGMRGKKLRRV